MFFSAAMCQRCPSASHLAECFPSRLHAMLSITSADGNVIGWTSNGAAWEIHNLEGFHSIVLPLFVGGSSMQHFGLFIDLVYYWGFRQFPSLGSYDSHGAFYHQLFHRDYPSLVCYMEPRGVRESQVSGLNSASTIDTILFNHQPMPSAMSMPRTAQPESTLIKEKIAHESVTTMASRIPPELLSIMPSRSRPSFGLNLTTEQRISDPESCQPQRCQPFPAHNGTRAEESSSLRQYAIPKKTHGQSLVFKRTKTPYEWPATTSKAKPQGGTLERRSIQQDEGSMLSQAAGATSQQPPMLSQKPKASRKLKHQDEGARVQTKTKKKPRSKWLPPLGPPIKANTKIKEDLWFCTNPESFADLVNKGTEQQSKT